MNNIIIISLCTNIEKLKASYLLSFHFKGSHQGCLIRELQVQSDRALELSEEYILLIKVSEVWSQQIKGTLLSHRKLSDPKLSL